MKNRITFLAAILLMVCLGSNLFGQGVAITNDGTDPDNSAMLDVKSTTMGLLAPRMTATERDAITAPATGLLVYVTDDNNFYYYNSSAWTLVTGANDGDWVLDGDTLYSAVDSTLVIKDGRIGIGTTTPDEKLHIAGNMRLDAAFEDKDGEAGGAGQILSSTATGTDWINAPPTDDGDWTISGNNMYSSVSGNVGIGTTNPGNHHLVLSKTSATMAITSGAGTCRLLMGNTDSNGADNPTIINAGNGNLQIGTGDSWTTAGGGTMAITAHFDDDGKVGIGTTDPTTSLTLGGSNPIISTGTSDANDNKFLKLVGGGDASSSRGAVIVLSGNEEPTYGGSMHLNPGGLPDAHVQIDGTLFIGGGNVGIGTTSSGAKLEIVKDNSAGIKIASQAANSYSQFVMSNPERDFVLTNNAADDLLSFNYDGGNRLQFNTSDQWFNGGNVGIGTPSPSQKLSVAGNAGITGNLSVGTGDPGGRALKILANGPGDGLQMMDSDGSHCLAFLIDNGDVAGELLLYNNNSLTIGLRGGSSNNFFNDGGNVGIGTTSPTVWSSHTGLHIKGYLTNAASLRLESSNANGQAWEIMSTVINGGPTWSIMDVDDAIHRLLIDGSGNVGIGTTNPESVLDISGSTGLTFRTNNSSSGFTIMDRPTVPGDQLVFQGNAGNYSLFNVATKNAAIGTEKLSTLAFWTVDIDNAANATQFQIQNSPQYGPTFFTQKLGTGVQGDKPISLQSVWEQSSTPTQLVLATDGRVGIGTPTPGAKLEVAGQVKITGGTPGTGKVLTSDANGLASWQSPPAGDNLGDHHAIQNIQMNHNWLSFDGQNEGIYIDHGGVVGIGTSNPGPEPEVKLDVNGDIKTNRGGIVTGITWNSIPKTQIGELPLNPLGTVQWPIPPEVPQDAKEVLVYVYIKTGAANPSADIEFKIFTQEGPTEYAQYFFASGFANQNAISYNSENIWLPITSNREIKVTSYLHPLTGYNGSAVNVIGYR
ncbi:MAG: hypothetical protein K8R53_07930 [Bacteroidales bacterium]|nr:hypothetical protein [Bacteroidales bacterium]